MNDYHQFSQGHLQANGFEDISNGEMSTLPSAALLAVLFEKTLDAMLIVDDEGKHIDANPSACKLFGLPRAELLTGYLSDFCESGTGLRLHTCKEILNAFGGELRVRSKVGCGSIFTVAIPKKAE